MTNPGAPTRGKVNKPPRQPFKIMGVAVLVVSVLVVTLVYMQYKGEFTAKTKLQMLSARAGLVMEPGAKITFNGVQIGRVASINEVDEDGEPAAKFELDVYPRYIKLIPSNVDARIVASTLFGNKYLSLTPPENPTPQRITPQHVIDARSVTTEINTLLETVAAITAQVDPVKLNLTLSAAAEALNGLGDKFGQSIVNANDILDDAISLRPQFRHDLQQLAAFGDIFNDAAPDLVDALDNGVVTARTLNAQRKDLDAALLSAVGLGNTGADVFGRGGPYLQHAIDDLMPATELLDAYSPEVGCSLQKAGEVQPKISHILGGKDGYALDTNTQFMGGTGLLVSPTALATTAALAPLTFGLSALANLIGGVQNPYVYPSNLPRTNAHGGPAGAPGCWAKITRDLWPGPYLVADTGASIAPYNHLDTGSPFATEYVWGRQVGDNTINP